MATLVNKRNREVKVIIPNMRESQTFYSDNDGAIGIFFKRDWEEKSTNQEDHWKPSKEQKPAESRERNKPKESWLSNAKYEIEHADELLIQRQEELKEIRELKKQEQKPICDIASDDAIESCMLHYLQSAANRKDDIEIIEDTKAYKSELISIIKKEQKPAEWSEEDREIAQTIMVFLKEPTTAELCPQLRKECQDWLKSLPERFDLQPKEGWSKEDEKMLEGVLMWLDDLEKQGEYVEKERSWLKSLRPQSHWKPSKQEIDAFETALKGEFQNGVYPAVRLCELFQKLKKLYYNDKISQWKPSEEQMEALEYVIRDYREDCCNATANYLQEVLDHLKNM